MDRPSESTSRKRRSHFTSFAKKRAFRADAPCSVVDPLLSLLSDVNRLRTLILEALEDVGFPTVLEGHTALHPQRTATFGSSSSHSSDDDVFHRYAQMLHQNHTNSEDKMSTTEVDIINRVLLWEDSCGKGVASNHPTLHHILCEGLAAQNHGSATVLINAKSEEEPLSTMSSDKSPSLRRIGVLDDEEVDILIRQCKNYEKKLKATSKCVFDYFQSLSAHPVPKGLAGHAKRAESTALVRETTSASPPSLSNAVHLYAERIAVHDAFATCQRAVHSTYLSFADAVELFLEEAGSVFKREKEYWENVKAIEHEYDLLREIIQRLHTFRQFLVSSSSTTTDPL